MNSIQEQDRSKSAVSTEDASWQLCKQRFSSGKHVLPLLFLQCCKASLFFRFSVRNIFFLNERWSLFCVCVHVQHVQRGAGPPFGSPLGPVPVIARERTRLNVTRSSGLHACLSFSWRARSRRWWCAPYSFAPIRGKCGWMLQGTRGTQPRSLTHLLCSPGDSSHRKHCQHREYNPHAE